MVIPSLNDTHCLSFSACGRIVESDKSLIRRLKKEGRITTKLSKKENASARLSLGDGDGRHFHLDVSRPTFFNNKVLPASTVSLKKFLDKIDQYMGNEVSVCFMGLFEVRIGELPDKGIIKSLFFQTQMGEVAIKVNAAKLVIQGAPICEISWQILKDGERIRLLIEAEDCKTTISEKYLSVGLQTLEQAFQVFILGRSPGEQK